MVPRLLIPVMAVGILAAGCRPAGPKLYPVKGKVVFEGGKAFAGGSVMFQSMSDEKMIASGEVQRDGTFEVYSINGGKGAVAGEHRVMVVPERPEWGANKSQPLGKYQRFDTSGLTFTVRPSGDNFCEITLRPEKR